MKKVPPAVPDRPCRLDALHMDFGLKLSHCKDFIPIRASADAVKALKPYLRTGRFGPASYIRQISAKMALSQPIAYDKTLIHEKTKVIGLKGDPACRLLVQQYSQFHAGSASAKQVPN